MRVAWFLFRNRPGELLKTVRLVRVRSLVNTLACFEDSGGAGGGSTRIWLRGSSSPIYLRKGTSDFDVFRQVVLGQQYALNLPADSVFVIDAGANVGLASREFLKAFPQAQILAIEADPDNYEAAKRNLSGYEARCTLINAAVWFEEGEVGISRGSYLDGREWSTQTVPAALQGEIRVPARTLGQLLDEYHWPRIDLLKMDIEGAELRVFRDGCTAFLKKTRCCAVECHGAECLAAFSAAATQEGFELRTAGELTVAERAASADCDHDVSGKTENRGL